MSYNDFFGRLLGLKRGGPTCNKLERSKKFKLAYKQWVAAQVYLKWTGAFFKAYHYKKANLPADYRVQLVQGEHTRGIIFFYDPSIGDQNFEFLFDLLKDRVEALGYTLHSCDTLEIRHDRYREQIEKRLLTPPASDVNGTSLCNQLYGNILLDHIKVNKRPGYIRLAANAYADSFFSRPLSFNKLLEQVLQPGERQQET
ncbi:hypothetical protein CLV24_108115 [Pontibacter ummariensis]|uniref:Uncharacterized protein n=1 Tax=Pontibacter ummariensis TaxID=1610492 RepID=A0A239FB02_9BACT|nr:hypothetical protein [Pontibacter ummariensis]PRY12371.1 hypothetical protein CLV24_108115 [Pontibacter ummariensis]SNS53264.1 hypothetical protein SAMN06296052_10870 [Pontibacter ummariensis]